MHNKVSYNDKNKQASYKKQTDLVQHGNLATSHHKNIYKENQSSNAEMVKVIMNTLRKLPSYTDKASTSTFGANNSTLTSVIATLLSELSFKVDPAQLSHELIKDYFRLLGYPYKISNNIFTPVGASHTWGSCLQMMEWLAQFVEYELEAKILLQDYNEPEPTVDSVTFECFLNGKDISVVEDFLLSDIEETKNTVKQATYEYETADMTIINLNKSQEDIPLLDENIEKLYALIDRELQEILSGKNNIESCSEEILVLEADHQRLRNKEDFNQVKISALEKDIDEAGFSEEQAEATKEYIKNEKEKMNRIREKHSEEMREMSEDFKPLMKEYSEGIQYLSDIQLFWDTMDNLELKMKLNLQIPELNIQKFSEFTSKNNQEPSLNEVRNTFKYEEFGRLSQDLQYIKMVLSKELDHLAEKTKQQQLKVHELEKQILSGGMQKDKLTATIEEEVRMQRKRHHEGQQREKAAVCETKELENLNDQHTRKSEQLQELKESQRELKADLDQMMNQFCIYKEEKQKVLPQCQSRASEQEGLLKSLLLEQITQFSLFFAS